MHYSASRKVVDAPSTKANSTSDSTPVRRAGTRVVTAKYPHHVWHIDLTVVPTSLGFWIPWFPFALLQCWPFCFWVAVVLDHFSRKALLHGVCETQPTTRNVTELLDVGIQLAGRAPKYIISDQGSQFREDYRDWCAARGIKPRFGAIGATPSTTSRSACTRSRWCARVHPESFAAGRGSWEGSP
jgi:transposase InsO family protein